MVDPITLTRTVAIDFPGTIQAVAALQDRLDWLRIYPDELADEIRAAERFLAAIRATFGIPMMTLAEQDAAHERALTELEQFVADNSPDVPEALASYWNRGA